MKYVLCTLFKKFKVEVNFLQEKKKRDINLIFFLFVHIARISKEIGTIPPWKDSNATHSSWPYPSDSINLSNLQALKQNYH